MITIRIAEPIKGLGNQSLFIYFDYDKNILEIIKTLPNRVFLPELKCWEVSAFLLDKVKYLFKDYAYQIFGRLKQDEEITYSYDFKTKPTKHQLEAIQYGLKNPKFMLGDEMGLGKSKEVLDIACIRKQRGEVKRALIICGINSLKFNWKNEIEKHTNEKCWILGQRKTRNGIRIGGTEEKIEDINSVPSEYMFLITNIESFRNNDISFLIKKKCENGEIDMLIFDEAHTMRNPDSKQAKGLIGDVKNLGIKAKYMAALSGTFILNKPLDLYAPLYWLGKYNDSFYKFKNVFSVVDNFGNYICPKNQDLMRKLLAEIMLRRLKEEVLDLPDKNYITEYLEMDAQQYKIYCEVMDGLRNDIDKIRLMPNPLTAMLRARQATGYTGLLSSTIKESIKFERLKSLVDEITRNGYKCIIYSNWAEMIKEAFKVVNQVSSVKSPQLVIGEKELSEVQQSIDSFNNYDNDYNVILGTIKKLGTGFTLNKANYVIFLDSPWTKGDKEQAIDRCHRIGQTKNVTIITLVCKDTIDEKVEEILENKGAMADMLIDGKVNTKMDSRQLVNYLLGD